MAPPDLRWLHRPADDAGPWVVAACAPHAQELVRRGFAPGAADLATKVNEPPHCPLCAGYLTLEDVDACRCGTEARCAVHDWR